MARSVLSRTSAASRPYLGRISAASRPHLGRISAVSQRRLRKREIVRGRLAEHTATRVCAASRLFLFRRAAGRAFVAAGRALVVAAAVLLYPFLGATPIVGRTPSRQASVVTRECESAGEHGDTLLPTRAAHHHVDLRAVVEVLRGAERAMA